MEYKFSKYNLIVDKTAESVLVYNSYTGSFCELNNSLYSTISGKSGLSSAIEHFNSLEEEGIIVPSCLDEYNRVIALEQERLYDKDPKSIYIVIALTLACNMNCKYCFESNRKFRNPIDHSVVRDIILYLKKRVETNKNLKILLLSWFGGEPLLGFEQIVEICDEIIPFCRKREVKVISSMITNGALLSKSRIRILIEKCNLTRIQITLDGTQDTYCNIKRTVPSVYKSVLRNIVHATRKLEVVIRLNASKNNIDELKKVVSVLFEDLRLINLIKIYMAEVKNYTGCLNADCNWYEYGEFELVKNEFYQYLEEKYSIDTTGLVFDRHYKDTSCGLLREANAVIGPHGELYKCEHGLGNPEEMIGTIQDGYFYNEKYNSFCGIHHFDKCKGCVIFPICLSGCRSQQKTFGENAVDCDGIKRSLILSLKKLYKKEVQRENID